MLPSIVIIRPFGITLEAMDVLQVAWELDDFLVHFDGVPANQAMDWLEEIFGTVPDGCELPIVYSFFYCFAILLGYLFQVIVHRRQLLYFCLFDQQ